MPPKKGKGKKDGKGGKGKGGAAKAAEVPEPPPELSEEVKAMIKQIEQLQKDVENEVKERNKFQLEVDMIRTFWEATGQQLEETNAELINLYSEIETDELNNRQDIKEYLGEIKLYNEDLKKHQKGFYKHVHKNEDVEVKPYEKERSEMILDEQLDIEDTVNTLKMKHNDDMAKKRGEMKEQLLQTEQKYKKKLELLQDDLTNKEKTKLSEREHYWSSLIHSLQQDHDKRYSEFDAFLNECKKKDLRHKDKVSKQIQVFVATEEKKKQRVVGSLDVLMLKQEKKKVQTQITKLQKLLRNPIMKKHPNEKIKHLELSELKQDHEVHDQKLKQLEQDIDELHKKFQQNIQDIQHRADEEITQLEAKLGALTDKLHRMQARVCSQLFGIDLGSLGGLVNQAGDNQALQDTGTVPDHWSRRTRLNQTVIWQLQNVKELLQRDVETAVKERTALIKLINEKIDELFWARTLLQKVTCQLAEAIKTNSGTVLQDSAPEPVEPEVHLQDDGQPIGGLMDEIVRIACKNPSDNFRTLMFDPVLDRQLRNTKELLQSHAELATKRRTQLILLLNDKTHQLHNVKRKVKDTNLQLEKQKIVAARRLNVDEALLLLTIM
ncbi:dynein regulatory complex subunit 4-like [Dunckerocampus dactyliophorus]|uniref:dynein regulatory complex subunit 4-like n=1 Tax=Dunckerocampus dactyliophorus TaxID=161453 RepID=UPI0024058525|nr:dynein regulatory complex subunit 4-like [Dunckerocampus dactyliophorus]